MVEYLDIPKEPPAVIENRRVPAYWPSSADNDSLLVVEDLEVKYAPDLPSVLHGVSFSLKAKERVGLLGRTGCGKSTLVCIDSSYGEQRLMLVPCLKGYELAEVCGTH